jgi:hypothetical protein
MTLSDFVSRYTNIVPSIDEVKERYKLSSKEEIVRYISEYDLIVYRVLPVYDLIRQLIYHTNIIELHNSPIHFIELCAPENGLIEFGYIEEKGQLYIGESDQLIYFFDNRDEIEEITLATTQDEFLAWYLHYLTIDFARLFRRSVKLEDFDMSKFKNTVLSELIWEIS